MHDVILAVADLHGHLEAFESLVAAADLRYGSRYTLVTLGDYVDNGPSTPQLLDLLIELQRTRPGRFLPIMGNHDLACARILGWQGAAPSEPWWEQARRNYWNGAQGVGPAYGATSAVDLARRMPRAHQDFLQELPWYQAAGEYVFVHAGLDAGPIAPQLEALARRELPMDPTHTPDALHDKHRLPRLSDPSWDRTVVSAHCKSPGAGLGHRHAPHFATSKRIALSAEVDTEGNLYAVLLPSREVLRANRRGEFRRERSLVS